MGRLIIKKIFLLYDKNLNQDIMKVQVPHFQVLSDLIELDFNDFETFSISIKGELESNQFLVSLWHEFDQELGEDGKCPWAYFPNRFMNKKHSVTSFGIMQTKIGHFYVMVSYKQRGSIDSIHFYSLNCSKDSYKGVIKGIIKKAVVNIDKLVKFTITSRLFSLVENTTFYPYNGTRFSFYDNESVNYIKFQLLAKDQFEATQLTEKRLRSLTAFLSIETNLYFDFDNISIHPNEEEISKEACVFQDDKEIDAIKGNEFIDYNSIFEGKIHISQAGVNFINKYIFVEREHKNPPNIHLFMKGCLHFYKGLKDDFSIPEEFIASSEHQTLAISPIGIFNKQSIINNSITYYLSALETISSNEGTQTTCSTCGQTQYKISQRVSDFIKRYLSDDLGMLFKKIYDIRSKYLHTGTSSSTNQNSRNRPLIDSSTGTGAKDYGFISVQVNGKPASFHISNVREWTSFCIRRYYKETILINEVPLK